MNEAIFTSASVLAMVGWLGLALGLLVPAAQARSRLLGFGGRQIPVVLCVLYVYVRGAHWGTAPGGDFASLQGVITLFAVPGKLLGGWIHFLAFDLLIGRGVIDHGLARGLPRGLLLTLLPVLFLYAPAGVAAYLLMGYLWRLGACRMGRHEQS